MYRGRAITSILLQKQKFDEEFAEFDAFQWYKIDTDKINGSLRDNFIQLNYDKETQEFLKISQNISDNVFLQLYYSIAVAFLQIFLSKTSINGILHKGSMFLFSHDHIRQLLNVTSNWEGQHRRLLDIGAGDGNITKMFEQYFYKIFVTEASDPMRYRLRRLGYEVLSEDQWCENDESYNLITCLNVIDRHERPLTLLKEIREAALKRSQNSTDSCQNSTGPCQILLAVVFPFSQYVEFGGQQTKPFEPIELNGRTIEEQIGEFVETVLKPQKFRIIRWTRLPYLCQGDMHQSFYVLNDIVFLLEAIA